MASWGVDSFENDDAVEWAAAYRENGLAVAGSTLQVALGDAENANLRADIATRAIAAVEAVGFALGRGSADANKLFEGAPAADPAQAAALVEKCDQFLTVVAAESELNEIWKNAAPGEHEKWLAALETLRARLAGASARPARVATAPSPAGEPLVEPSVVADDAELDDIRMMISSLSADIDALREEMNQNFRKLARYIDRGRQ